MERASVLLCVLCVSLGCGDDAADPDAGGDASVDGGADATVDGDPDAQACPNGVLDELEACDGTVFRDDATCESFGLPAGTLACSETCEVDTAGCAVCDDGICSDGETSASCAEDCGVRSIAAGRTHSCAVLADGSLWCWGAHDGHRMGGTADTNVPVRVPGHEDVVQVSVGDHHTCFIDASDRVWCFGSNGFGEAGPSPSHDVFPPVMVTMGVSVSAGVHHTCAIEPVAGDVECWGRGDHGQRGDGMFSMREGTPGVVVADTQTRPALAIELGGHISCAALDSETVRCWGDNTHGVMSSDREWKNTPRTAFALPGARLTGAAMGHKHVCFNFNQSDGTRHMLICIGSNAFGQLGSEPSTDLLSGNGIEGEHRPAAAGFGFTCAQDISGPNLRCWGDNYFGQLGDGTLEAHHVPADVTGIDEVVWLSAGSDHICAILPDETARCWGRNREGQLGNASDERGHSTPVTPIGLGGAR